VPVFADYRLFFPPKCHDTAATGPSLPSSHLPVGTRRPSTPLPARSRRIPTPCAPPPPCFPPQLFESNFDLHFKLLLEHTEEILPNIYTPTVGEACQRYGELGCQTRGLYITKHDRGNVLAKLQAWPHQDCRVIVVTDGERILGLGDLGAGGMGISEGKITLYTAGAGVDPHQCLPVCLDVGTNNPALLESDSYQGIKERRIEGDAYYALVDEFMAAVKAWRPHVLVQFEDFANHSAFHHLTTHRDSQPCFNDDIQGTACVALAGLFAALRVTGRPLSEQVILFHGAGEAGIGIGDLMAMAIAHDCGIPLAEAKKRCIFLDSKGLVCKERLGHADPKLRLQHHKEAYAHDLPHLKDLSSAIDALKPTALVGVSTQGGSWTPEIIRQMAAINERPIMFPLSNPTHLSEMTYAEALRETDGRVVFASGSPFPGQEWRGVPMWPAQANNAYIFPAVGHAAILTNCTSITDDVFLVAAHALAALSPDADLAQGLLFPRFRDILKISAKIIAACAAFIVAEGLGTAPADFSGDWEAYARGKMWNPSQKASKL